MPRENFLAALAVALLAAVPACQPEMRQPPPPVAPVQTTLPKLVPTPTPPPVISDAPPAAPMPPSQREVGAPVVRDTPYAKPVPGKPGFVTLPGTSGQIDVRGMSPGEQVKDPATGQVFLVP